MGKITINSAVLSTFSLEPFLRVTANQTRCWNRMFR